jgi:thiosulfate/3-mercaptopyruvate sulfurtransferase
MNIIKASEIKPLSIAGDTVIIDARGGADAEDRFETSHLEGALFVNLETDLSIKPENAAVGGRHPLPEAIQFGALLGTLGITPSTRIIVYDDKRGAMAAARFWWMMKAIGHEEVYVVSGGLEAIQEAGLNITDETETLLTEYPVYPVENWVSPVANLEKVAEAVANDDYLVIDVRENFRFRGESEPIDLIAGHIPGTINIPYTGNMDTLGNFLSAEELREKYKAVLGQHEPAKIIVHCGSGVTACHTILALEEAGFEGAQLYVGSWSEWSRNDRPVATGDL